MALTITEIKTWFDTLADDAPIGIVGLTLATPPDEVGASSYLEVGGIPEPRENAGLGVCAKCREDLTSMRGVRTAKGGARFHGRCWRNDR